MARTVAAFLVYARIDYDLSSTTALQIARNYNVYKTQLFEQFYPIFQNVHPPPFSVNCTGYLFTL